MTGSVQAVRQGRAPDAGAVPPPPQAGRRSLPPWAEKTAIKLSTALVILAVWEAGVRLFAPDYVARPLGIASVLVDVLYYSAEFRDAFLGTVLPLAQGLVIAVALAVVVGLAMGQLRPVAYGLKIYVYGLFALPMVAVVPLVTMWFGYTDGARLAVIVFAGFFPMALNVYDGARSVPAEYMEVARSFRSGRLAVWFGVVLPSSLPYLLAGFRLAMGRVLVGAVVVEYMISLEGLGRYIQRNARAFNHDEAFVAVLLLALFGVGAVVVVRLLTRWICPWYRPTAD
jgi:ABC-type nitrate/sulfonate/bicarbonate transport system permease component